MVQCKFRLLDENEPDLAVDLTVTIPEQVPVEDAAQAIAGFIKALSALAIACGCSGFVVESKEQ